ncbi:MAG: hypothetical protein ACLFOY_19285 [Desulfatibacillaceae bacterium]
MHKRAMFVFAAIVLAAAGAAAYVLPPGQVVEFMNDSLGNADTLAVSEKVVYHGQAEDGGNVELTGTAGYDFPESFREDVSDQGSSYLYVASPEGVVKVRDEEIVANAESLFDHYKDPFLYRDEDRLMQALADAGVDTSVSSLGRWDDRVVFVIGAQYPDESVPQLWVDREMRVPVRYIVRGYSEGRVKRGLAREMLGVEALEKEEPSGAAGREEARAPDTWEVASPDEMDARREPGAGAERDWGLLDVDEKPGEKLEPAPRGAEVRYEDWRDLGDQGLRWYPARILFVEGDRVVEERVLEDYRVNASFEPDYFAVSRIRQAYGEAGYLEGGGEKAREGMDEVERTVEDFRRVFE